MTFQWTPEVVERTAEMLKSGHTAREIGDAIGTTRRAVVSKVGREQSLRTIGFGKGQSRPKKAVVIPLPSVAPDEYDASARRVTLMDLENTDCRWIVEGEKEHALFCGHPVSPGGAMRFCRHHTRRAMASTISDGLEPFSPRGRGG